MMMKRNRGEDCYSYIKAVRQTGKYNNFLQVMKEFKSLPYSTTALDFVATRIKQVFNGHSNLILGFHILFMPKGYYGIEEEEDGAAHQKNRAPLKSTERVVEPASDTNKEALLHDEGVYVLQDYNFFEKEKIRNTDEYKKFLKCLYLYSKEIISRDELVAIVGDLLQYHGTAFPSTANKDKVHKESEKDERETSTFDASASKKRKIEERMIDRLSRCEIENPSYELSTERTKASGRTEFGKAVLNDTWVSNETPPTSDTYQFKKNIYQRNLFKCEDDRCERDRQSELVKSTIECMEELLQKITDNKINLEILRLEDHFKLLHLGCIKRLYGESWQDVVEALPKNAISVLHHILTRLQKKLKDVTSRLSVTYKKKMAVVYLKNFRKSLDHGNTSCELQNDTTSSNDKDHASTSCPNLLCEATK